MLKRSWVNLLLVFLPLLAGMVEFVLINVWAQALPPFMVTADFGIFAFVFGMTIRNLGIVALLMGLFITGLLLVYYNRAIRRQEQTRPRSARKKETVADQARLAARALAERKAQDVLILDLRGLSEAADFFVIASGTSDTHVRAVADHAIEALAGAGRAPHHAEGLSQGRWVLLDFVDFVVHVFHPAQRDFYQLERLWADAPRLAVVGGGEG